ncbi:MAG: hypothetical protein KGL39_17560 [Patescibacteria group bacterium]|nr:hypothetical protein [Patescibacteria group bacterium]
MAKMLDRAAILGASDIQTEIVEVPEWGGAVTVRGLSGKQRAGLEAMLALGKDGKATPKILQAFYGALVIESVIDKEGKHLFEPTDRDALTEKSGAALQHIIKVAVRLSGLEEAAQDAEREIADDPKDAFTLS